MSIVDGSYVIVGQSATPANNYKISAPDDGTLLIQKNPTSPTTMMTFSGSAPYYGCRGYIHFNGQSGGTVYASGNMSFVRTGTGTYTITITSGMPTANYCFVGSANEDGGVAHFCNPTQPTTSGFVIRTYNASGVLADCTYVNAAVFS